MTSANLESGVFALEQARSDALAQHYQAQGWVHLRGWLDLETDILPIHAYVNHLIDLKLAWMGLRSVEPKDKRAIRSADYLQLCRVDRELGGEIYRACRHLCALHRLSTKPELLDVSARLMGTEFVNFIPYTAMRIDVRGEEKYLFPWQQDYPYTQGSIDGVVLWIPLFDLAEGEGGVSLIPGSHQWGLQPVEVVDPDNVRRNGAHTIRIANMERFDGMATVTPRVKAGDILLFSTLLVHRSEPMTAGDVRWTTQIRYANFSNPDAVRRGWPGGMIEGVHFERDHPEFIVRGGDVPAGDEVSVHGR
jgi:hypothetical protein